MTRWKILLVLSIGAVVVLLPLLLHARGIITLSFLASESREARATGALDWARNAALQELSALAAARREGAEGALDAVRARRAVERLRATAEELERTGRAGQRQMDKLRAELPWLEVEIRARLYMAQGAHRLAYEDLAPRVKRAPESMRKRLQDLLAELRLKAGGDVPLVEGLQFVKVGADSYYVGTPKHEVGRQEKADDSGRLPDRAVGRIRLREYWISTTEIPRAVFARYSSAKSWSDEPHEAGRLPASGVSVADARSFCERLSAPKSAFVFDLPTEDEWEVACRAGEHPDTGPFVVEDEVAMEKFRAFRSPQEYSNQLESVTRAADRFAAYRSNGLRALLIRQGRSGKALSLIRRLEPNRLGLYDIHGNVAELCRRDGSIVLRGGHCASELRDVRAGSRRRLGDRPDMYGFRIVARPKPR